MKRFFFSLTMSLACLSFDGQPRVGTLHLFPDEVKAKTSPIVYDFLERYLYEASRSKRGYDFFQKMADEKVVVREGSLENISKLSPSVTCKLDRYEDKGYNICWTDTMGRVLLSMQFPLQYELLLGKKKEELDEALQEELEKYSRTYSADTIDTLKITAKGEDGVYQPVSVSNYYVKSLNTATYYQKKDSVITSIYSSNDKWHSAANLFQGLTDSCENYILHIEQVLYGFKRKSYNIRLAQWLNYCKENHLIVYFGIEEERKDGLKALLIAQNKDLGYNHMLSIILPDNFVERRDAILKVIANTYIRTDNIKNLYNDYKKINNETKNQTSNLSDFSHFFRIRNPGSKTVCLKCFRTD